MMFGYHEHPSSTVGGNETDINRWKRIDATFLSNDLTIPGCTNYKVVPIMARLNHILNHPNLFTRVTDLATFLTCCDLDTIRGCFPLIVENVFGTGVINPGWSLRSMTRQSSPKEVDQICRLLGPDGPLINASYRLMEDGTLRFEFPINILPPAVITRLLRGEDHYFSGRVNSKYDPYNHMNYTKSLYLNPFEYYLFYFASVNLFGCHGDSSYLTGWGSSVDSVYMSLFEEYLAYFFPCDGSSVATSVANNTFRVNESSFITNPVQRNQFPTSSTITRYTTPGHVIPSLFKAGVFTDQNVGTAVREPNFTANHPYAQKETWRTELFLRICIELWMNVDSPEDTSRIHFETKLPSVDLVKSIRMLVRHVHFFMNCVNGTAFHPMDEIKSTTFPMFQRKLYILLRHLFDRWPLDNSFRIVYETWLSYIQPWRYVHADKFKCAQSRDREGIEIHVDGRWYNFILENILFYTKLFHCILPRLLRADLTATKNALMLFRVAKIFTIDENIKTMLMNIEHEALNCVVRVPFSGAEFSLGAVNNPGGNLFGRVSPMLGVGYGPPVVSGICFDTNFSVRVANVKQSFKEIESAQFQYKPLFGEKTRQLIIQLLYSVQNARAALNDSLMTEDSTPEKNVTWYQWLSLGLIGRNSRSNYDTGPSVAERKKAISQLEHVRYQLSFLFDVPLAGVMESSHSVLYDSSCSWNQWSSSSEFSSDVLSTSNPLSRSGVRKFYSPVGVIKECMLKPIGNPDSGLIRSDEVLFLVRFFICISDLCNTYFGDKIEDLYYERSFKGKVARSVFARPREFCDGRKGRGFPLTTTKEYLPARINLRFMGTHYFMIYFLAYLCFGYVLGAVNQIGWIMWMILPISLYVIFRAFSEPSSALDNLFHEFAYHFEQHTDPVLRQALLKPRLDSEPMQISFDASKRANTTTPRSGNSEVGCEKLD